MGVQPESTDLGLELTHALKNSLGYLVAAVVADQLQEWGVQMTRL